jgi:hypothetical protein
MAAAGLVAALPSRSWAYDSKNQARRRTNSRWTPSASSVAASI